MIDGVLHREQLSVCVEQLIYQHHHIIKPIFRKTDFLLDKYPVIPYKITVRLKLCLMRVCDEEAWR